MYRGFIKTINNLSGLPIGNSDLRVRNISIRRDILTSATSEFEVLGIPDEAEIGNVFGCYDEYGKIIYVGVISNIDDNTIQTNQIISLFNDKWLWNDPQQVTIEQTVRAILQSDFQNNNDSLVADIFSQFDLNISSTGTPLLLPTQDENYVVNFMDFIFQLYQNYQILLDINIPYGASRPSITILKPNYPTIKLSNNTNTLQDFNIMQETYETNKLILYAKDGTYRGTWYGTTQGISTSDDYTNRLPKIRTNIVFSDDPADDIVADNLSNQMYNHKIEVNLILNNKLYNFDDFHLGQTFEIYHKGKVYNSVLTGYAIEINESGASDKVTLTFGIVRVSLIDKLNKLILNNQRSSGGGSGGGGGITPSSIVNIVYPVGSIYMSVSNTSPATLFGGTWVQLKDRFLLGAGDTYTGGNTGGEATHTLTVDEMPSHNHTQSRAVPYGVPYNNVSGAGSGSGSPYYSETYSPTFTINNTGGGQAHNNMPPFLVVFIWQRTA